LKLTIGARAWMRSGGMRRAFNRSWRALIRRVTIEDLIRREGREPGGVRWVLKVSSNIRELRYPPQRVTITGLDINGKTVTETVVLNGTEPVYTKTRWLMGKRS
jgi:hypothetical protein